MKQTGVFHRLIDEPRRNTERRLYFMKRFLSALLCLALIALPLLLRCAPALAEGAVIKAQWMPNEVLDFFSSSNFNGWTIGERASILVENTVGGTFFFAVAQKAGHNVLYGFEQKNGYFNYWLKTDSAIAQGEGFFVMSYHSGELYLFDGTKKNIGEGFGIMFTRADYEEQHDNNLYFSVDKSGQFHLKVACVDYGWEEVLVTSDSLAYSFEGTYEGTAYGTVETNLRYFSYAAFPKTLKEAKNKLTQAPTIPSGELSAQKIKFTGGQKLPVYSGPGAEYERAANGKASVSTNDWLQVFGSESGFIMIQYAISASQMRIGYIDQSALPKNANVSALRFAWEDAEITASTFLTDDPLNSQTRARALSAGQQVKWLSTMGNWVYVELAGSGQPIRGFVPSGAIRQASPMKTYDAFFSNSVYTAQASVAVTGGVSAKITVTVSGPAAWQQTDADSAVGYQVYANNAPLNILSSDSWYMITDASSTAVFTLSVALPTGTTVLGLCPIHAQSGMQTGEMITVFLNDAMK